MTTNQQEDPQTDDVCAVLTTIMAHGCNIGPYTMAQLVSNVSYKRIKNITDWMLKRLNVGL
ncbi:MAG: Tn3 family transposase [Desulforhopalus sp.]